MTFYGSAIRKPSRDMVLRAKQPANKGYNLTDPVVWLNCNAKNSYKCRNIFRKPGVNPLRWAASFATVFPEDQTTLCSLPNHSVSTTQQSLFCQRCHPRRRLSNYPWIGTDRNQHFVAAKRCLPVSGKSADLSQSHHLTAVSRPLRFTRPDSFSKSPRSISKLFFDKTRSPLFHHLRPRHQSADGLWTTARSQGGVQPQKARASFLSTPSLFRGENRRYLGRDLPLRRCPSGTAHDRDSGKKCHQVALGNSRDSRKGRLGFLRSCHCRVPPGYACFLCHCCTDHQADPKILRRSFLRGNLSWALAFRVRIQTLAMENLSTLYRDSTSYSRKTFLAAFAFQDDGIYLPCDRYQPLVKACQSLAFLQSESHRGTHYSRTARSLYPWQNTYPGLGLQSGLLSPRPFRLQLDQLVQTPLLAGRLAAAQSSDYSKPITLGTGSIASCSRETDSKFTEQLPILGNLYEHFKKYQETFS